MLYPFFQRISKYFPIQSASAHCDIPCGIYDPITSQLAALSVIRLIDLIDGLRDKQPLSLDHQAQLSRLVYEKEIHANKVKDEVRIIWGDYFKSPQSDKDPKVSDHLSLLVHQIMSEASACKQEVNRDKGKALLKSVNEFSKYFWDTKNVSTYNAVCPYPPEEELVYPDLKGS